MKINAKDLTLRLRAGLTHTPYELSDVKPVDNANVSAFVAYLRDPSTDIVIPLVCSKQELEQSEVQVIKTLASLVKNGTETMNFLIETRRTA